MPSAPVPTQKSEPHVRAARARWGPERSVRLDSLDPRIRAAVVALINADDAARTTKAATDVTPVTAGVEGHGNDTTTP